MLRPDVSMTFKIKMFLFFNGSPLQLILGPTQKVTQDYDLKNQIEFLKEALIVAPANADNETYTDVTLTMIYIIFVLKNERNVPIQNDFTFKWLSSSMLPLESTRNSRTSEFNIL